ncbi:MAG: hypothetical protein ACRCZD_17775 [Phycicoccus sp.]
MAEIKMTQDELDKIIERAEIQAWEVGHESGLDEGYESGYQDGHAEGYAKAQDEFA